MNSNTMKWLVRREYWENKGGFVWAPLVVAAIATAFALVAATISVVFGHGHAHDIHWEGSMAEHQHNLGGFADLLLMIGNGMTSAVLAFVLFFYLLGSLYDDRRDRSILFWKSMPISDREMVFSKLAWALLLAPVFSIVVGLALGLVFWIIAGISSLFVTVPESSAFLTASHPFSFLAGLVVTLPVQMIWSLPTVGWLMLCSSWSRRMPFLWAVAVPVLGAIMISFTDVFPGIEIDHASVWYTLVLRGLASVAPYTWLTSVNDGQHHIGNPGDISNMIDVTRAWQAFAHANIWIGAAVGIAMLVVATRLRRWREEG